MFDNFSIRTLTLPCEKGFSQSLMSVVLPTMVHCAISLIHLKATFLFISGFVNRSQVFVQGSERYCIGF